MSKPTLSPTKISTFLACPVRYRWTFVDSRGRLYLRAKSYYSFGTSLHRVLERFYRAADVGVETTAEAVAALEENWIDSGFSSAEEMSEAMHEGVEMLERHVEEYKKRESRAKVLYVEKQFKLDMGRFDLVGRIDRVDEREDGTLEIVDYKTGRDSVTPEEVADDIAMGCYQLMLAREHPGRPVMGTIFALRSGNQASSSMSETELDQFQDDLGQLGDHILSLMEDHFDLVPKPKRLCERCDFLALCLRHPDFAEAHSAISEA